MGSIVRRFDLKKLQYVPVSRVPTITGNPKVDANLNKLTGGRIDNWLQSYEHFLGIADIREAQAKVTEAQNDLDNVRKLARTSADELETLHAELRTLRGKIERVPREDRRYLDLATEEHRLLQMEKHVKEWQKKIMDDERARFDHLSAAVRESHEKERARAERTKYWSIIGSVTGTVIGVFGSTLITRYRMKEIRTLLEEAKETSQQAPVVVREVAVSTSGAEISNDDMEKLQQGLEEMQGCIKDMKTAMSENDVKKLSQAIEVIKKTQSENLSILGKDLGKKLENQEKALSQELRGFKELLTTQPVDTTGSGVTRSRMLENMLDNTEEKLEWQMKMSTLSTVVFIYGAFALTLPILYSIFK
ncbi:mitochondrial potassium channel-like [Glandiceps talaboti]